MIGDHVNTILSRRPKAYHTTSFCADCGQLRPVAQLVQVFARPILVTGILANERTDGFQGNPERPAPGRRLQMLDREGEAMTRPPSEACAAERLTTRVLWFVFGFNVGMVAITAFYRWLGVFV